MGQEDPVAREVREDQQQTHQESLVDREDQADLGAQEALMDQEDRQQNNQELQVNDGQKTFEESISNTVNSHLTDTPLSRTFAFTDKIQIPGRRSLTPAVTDSRYHGH